MVDDILLTPEEQDERARQWLKDNGLAIVLGVGLGLGAVFGYQTWQAKLKTDAETASALYNQALTSIQSSELADISTGVEQLKQDFSDSPYAVKASLLRAKQLVASDLEAAADELAWAVGHAKEPGLVNAAKIRQAKVLIAQGSLSEAKAIASSASAAGFSSNYQEILGDIAALEKDFTAARDYYQAARDQLAPRALQYGAILDLKMNRLPAASQPAAELSSESSADITPTPATVGAEADGAGAAVATDAEATDAEAGDTE